MSAKTTPAGRRRWRWVAIPALLGALALGAAACGGSSPTANSDPTTSTTSNTSTSTTANPPTSTTPPSTSGASTTTTTVSPTTTTTSPSSTHAATLLGQLQLFAQCMRAQGITDFPDPTIGSNGQPTFANMPPPTPQAQAATQACHKYTPAANGFTGPGQSGSSGNSGS